MYHIEWSALTIISNWGKLIAIVTRFMCLNKLSRDDNSGQFQHLPNRFCHSGSLSVCNETRLIIPISFLNPQLKCHDLSLVSYGFPRNGSCAETAKCALAAASASHWTLTLEPWSHGVQVAPSPGFGWPGQDGSGAKFHPVPASDQSLQRTT